MISKLFSYLQKPALWQRSPEPFWDDEHISKGLLEAHLNPDWDAASRNHSYIERSVKWLKSLIPEGGKILDLGCGPGLYARQLSDAGYYVTGIDFSRRSFAYAMEHDPKTEYIYRNYLEMDYTEAFDAILLIYCDYGALIPEERRTLLSKVHRALKSNGLFIFDVFTERTHEGKCDHTYWSWNENGGFWSGKPHLSLEAEYYYQEHMAKVKKAVVVTDNTIDEYLFWDTVFSRQTLLDEVAPSGLKLHSIYDDVCGSPYSGEADTLCLVLKKEC